MNIDFLLQNATTLITTPRDVAKLRQTILTLAVQGKLVPQEDKLLHNVDNSNTEAPFSNLPLYWKLQSLEDNTHIIRGVTFPGNVKSRTKDREYVACLRTASVQKSIDWDDLIYIPQEYVKNASQWILKNDIVISMANSFELVGKVAIVRGVPERATFGAFLGVIRSTTLDPEYLMIALSCPIIQSQFRESSSQTTNIANISLSKLRNIEIPVPPLAEQRRIVARVDELMAICDTLEAQLQARVHMQARVVQAALARVQADPSPASIATLLDPKIGASPADLRQTILTLAVQGKLVPQEAGDEPAEVFLKRIWSNIHDNRHELFIDEKPAIYDLPNNWYWVYFGEIINFTIGKTPSRNNTDYWSNGLYPWVSIADMNHNHVINETKEKVSALAHDEIFRGKIAERGSILMSFKLTIGKISRAMVNCFHNEAIISFKPPEDELSDYLFKILPIVVNWQTSNSAVMGSTLNKDLLRKIPIPLPPLAEQRRIVARVDELMALVDRLEAQQAQASALGAQVLDALVGGV